MTRSALFAVAMQASALLHAATVHAQWVTPPVSAPGVQYRTFPSAAAGTAVSYHILLPPEYEAQPERRFPVLYWLHGSAAALNSIVPISGWFRAAMSKGLIPPMLVVIPNGMSYRMWCDSFDGAVPMEEVVLEDLLPEVDANFRTVAAREGRIVEGFSMGGQGAARFGFRRPDLFAGVSILGAGPLQADFLDAPRSATIPLELRLQIYEAVWGSDPEYYTAQHPLTIAAASAAELLACGTRIRQAIGDLDALLDMNLDAHAALTALGLEVELSVLPGVGHSTPDLFTAMGAANWPFYRELFDGFVLAPGDLDGDGSIDAADLGMLLGAWGSAQAAADLDGDGVVGAGDLAILLGGWSGVG